jgi:hypothetical protein
MGNNGSFDGGLYRLYLPDIEGYLYPGSSIIITGNVGIVFLQKYMHDYSIYEIIQPNCYSKSKHWYAQFQITDY